MKKLYKFEYDYWWDVEFEVDLDIYTKEIALETLDFFCWKYNKDNNPVDEALKKIAIECLALSVRGLSVYEMMYEFRYLEGFPDIDGKDGIKLRYIDNFKFSEDELTLEIKEL